MKLIDADKVKIESRKHCIDCKLNGTKQCKTCVINLICERLDLQPTVEPFEPDYVGAERLEARQRGYADGYHNGMEIGKTLNPRIKQGKWIFSRCDQCGAYHNSMYRNFCPNCGADMRGDNNG